MFGLSLTILYILSSAYINSIKRATQKQHLMFVTQTGSAIKNNSAIILRLTPLLFSEFKSVSQLAEITMLSASIALFFDLIFIPKLIRSMIQ